MKRFITACLILSFFLSVLWLLFVHFNFIENLPSLFWETNIFLIITTCLLFMYLYKAGQDQFIQLYILTMVVKLIAYGGFAVFVILEDRSQASLNIGFFLFSYLAFTVLELVFLYSKINR